VAIDPEKVIGKLRRKTGIAATILEGLRVHRRWT
jgi:hypothetical protein